MESPKPVPCLPDYADVVGPEVIEEIRVLARRVEGRRIQNINSTPVGGGVAEILTRLVPLLNEVGVQARWDVMRGDNAFFAVTKASLCTATRRTSPTKCWTFFVPPPP